MSIRFSKEGCPICSRTGGSCAESTEILNGIVCYGIKDESKTPNGWRWVKYLGKNMGSLIAPLVGDGELETLPTALSPEELEKRRLVRGQREAEREAARLEKEAEKEAKLKALLSISDRNEKFLRIIAKLGLSFFHHRKLSDRGLTDSEIETLKNLGFRTWRSNLPIPNCEGLPGVINGKLKYSQGYIIPAHTPLGEIVGAQLANDDTGFGKYVWLSSSKQEGNGPQLPNGELPLFVWRNPESPICKEVWLCEGALKSAITAIKLWNSGDRIRKNVVVIGTACSASYGETLQEYLQALSPSIVRILPDAGSTSNDQIFENNNATADRVISWGHEVRFGWWGQSEKTTHKDIDELLVAGEGELIKWIEADEYKALGAIEDDAKTKGNQQQAKPKIPQWAQDIYNDNRSFTPQVTIAQRYLLERGDDSFDWYINAPAEGTITAIKSQMGTGKTHLLQHWFESEWKDDGVICLGYRNGLLYQLTNKLNGLEHLHDKEGDGFLRRSDKHSKQAFCDASLPNYEVDDFDNKVLIIDEATSVIKSIVSGGTCKNKRHKIHKRFIDLCLRSSRIILMDANLTDYVVDFIESLAPDKGVTKIENKHQTYTWDVKFMEGTGTAEEGNIKINDDSPYKAAILAAENSFAVFSDNQKMLEALDIELSAQGKKGIRIDSSTSSSDEGVAFLSNPDKWIEANKPQYILCSPSAESGLDISIKHYFEKVFYLGAGVIDIDSAMQMLGRVRDEKAIRYVFVKSRGIGEIDYGTLNRLRVLNEMKAHTKAARELAFLDVKDGEFFCEFLGYLENSKMLQFQKPMVTIEVLKRYEKINYRQALLERLQQSGHNVSVFSGTRSIDAIDANDKIKERISAIKDERSAKIVAAADINEVCASKYRQKPDLNPQQQAELEKFNLKKKLPDTELNVQLVRKLKFDEVNLLKQMELFFLIEHPDIAARVSKGKHKYFIEQFGFCINDSQADIALRAEALRRLNIKEYLSPDIKWTPECAEFKKLLARFNQIKKSKFDIEAALGFTIGRNDSPKTMFRKLMKCFGLIGFKPAQGKKTEKGVVVETYWKIAKKKFTDSDRALILEAYGKRFGLIPDVSFDDVLDSALDYIEADFTPPEEAQAA